MIENIINNTFIQIETNHYGVITSIISGNLAKKEFSIGDSIYDTCSFLEVTLESLALNQLQTIEGMVIVSSSIEFNIDVELFKEHDKIIILLIDKSNVYGVVKQLNQDRNDLFLMKGLLAKQNKELERLREVAEKANEDKSRFLAVMSHEIRTPLNSILGFGEVIESEAKDPKIKEYINYLINAGVNLKVIVNDILDLSRIDVNKLELAMEPISLSEIVQTSVKNFISQSEKNAILLTHSLSKDIPKFILGDSVRLTQILSNLISNALKFTKKGSVTIKVDVIDEQPQDILICIKVIDTGRGMQKHMLEKIFNEYEQTELNDSRLYGGAGLGLSIVKHLVESMKGKINVKSKLAAGTTFSIEIPFKKTASSNLSKELNKDNKNNDLKGLEILLADDDKLNQILIKHIFETVHAKITIANDGHEAIQYLKTKKFDVALLDINMPNMSGEEVVKAKKSFAKTNKTTPLVAITANASKIDIDHYKAIGFSSFIGKPHTHEKLKEVITSLINPSE